MKQFLVIVLLTPFFITSCNKLYHELEDKIWKGELYRTTDDKVLSDIILKFSHDTLFVFSNAIFGADNDTLLFQSFAEADSVLVFKSPKGDTFNLKYSYLHDERDEHLDFLGKDFYIMLTKSNEDLRVAGILNFYKNKKVPIESYMYLDGAYEGVVEMEDEMANYFLSEIGGLSIKLVFINDFKVRVYVKNLMLSYIYSSVKPKYETVDYWVEGNKLFLSKNKSKVNVIEVKDWGETLVLETDDANVILYKIY